MKTLRLQYLFSFFISIGVLSCSQKPKIPISNTLEIALDKSYNDYVSTLNKAFEKDTLALKKIIEIKNIGGAAGYDHGWVLVQLMKNYGDEKFFTVLKGLNIQQLNNLKQYFEVGLDGIENSNDTFYRQYQKSLQYLKLYHN
jgi:hypothetical protein